jgi:hypothetical protein
VLTLANCESIHKQPFSLTHYYHVGARSRVFLASSSILTLWSHLSLTLWDNRFDHLVRQHSPFSKSVPHTLKCCYHYIVVFNRHYFTKNFNNRKTFLLWYKIPHHTKRCFARTSIESAFLLHINLSHKRRMIDGGDICWLLTLLQWRQPTEA